MSSLLWITTTRLAGRQTEERAGIYQPDLATRLPERVGGWVDGWLCGWEAGWVDACMHVIDDEYGKHGRMDSCMHARMDARMSWQMNKWKHKRMDSCIHACKDGWVDAAWKHRCTDARIDGCKDGWVKGCMDGWMDRYMKEGVDEWQDPWMDGWTDGWTDNWLATHRSRCGRGPPYPCTACPWRAGSSARELTCWVWAAHWTPASLSTASWAGERCTQRHAEIRIWRHFHWSAFVAMNVSIGESREKLSLALKCTTYVAAKCIERKYLKVSRLSIEFLG